MRHWSMLPPLASPLLFKSPFALHLSISAYVLSLWHRSFFFCKRSMLEESTDEHDPLHRFRIGYLEMARFVYVRTEQTI